MNNIKIFFKTIGVCFLALCIPALLVVETIQAHRYTSLENQLRTLEKSQIEAIESNKRLITDIGLLSSSSRIERIAIEELGMHIAASDEIVRVEMRGNKKN